MKFNVTFMGPEPIAHLRRDLMLLLHHSLIDCGHESAISLQALEKERVNIVIGGYFLPPQAFKEIAAGGFPVIHLNSEVIARDMLNFNPEKVDFLGAYLPFLRYGIGVWETVIDNMPELARYGLNHHFLRFAWHEKLEDITHAKDKDLDFYFFGMMSERRQKMLARMTDAGMRGFAHGSCPYFVRNSAVARAKLQLNLIQKDVYTHVNCYRIGYLMNNRCAIVSEKEHDPAGFLTHAVVTDEADFVEVCRTQLSQNLWQKQADEAYEAYRRIRMRDVMAEALEHSFGGKNAG